MNYGKKVILYLSHNQNLSAIAAHDLRQALRNYDVVTGNGSKENIKGILKSVGRVERIALVCSDHILSSGRRAWHAVEELRREGYNGKVIWLGYQQPPEEKRYFFQDTSPKRGLNLVNHVRRNLESVL